MLPLEKLIPRLLNPLTAVHGDLWKSNLGTGVQTGEVPIYDACVYYAHHEKVVGIGRREHREIHGEDYQNEDFENLELSEFDDRNRLILSRHCSCTLRVSLALKELNWLINKYHNDM